ncbi:acyltransferase family protein [Flammeovirga sp. OC4]|uniref:acyltransferase family protein n=1 Tax=Flammeovirga sp. OC4 TaxID=1382345 RepID=UPI0005C5B5A8|nr:heparan-alpha-glucosaminide N-acetyltransferase domain-containing protein [Flammeovirga sp. OC4]
MNKSERILSLDIFRGLTVILMILVNNPGTWSAIYPPFQHAQWHGCTPTDLVFPFFLFIVGVSISFSMSKVKNNPIKRPTAMRKALWRGAKLIGIGLFLGLFPFFNFAEMRIPGVLQRIGVVFIITSALFLYADRKTILATLICLLVVYWLVMTIVPVPGIGVPNLDDPNAVLSAYIDQLLLKGHMWSGTKTWDPEGVFTTIPAIGTAILGLFSGEIVKKYKGNEVVKRLTVWGVVGVVIGQLWGIVFPINKSLWTSSYVLYTGGLGAITLGLSYYIFDYKKKGRDHVLIPRAFGLNPMAAYVLAEMIARLIGVISIGDATIKGHIFSLISLNAFPIEANSLLFAFSYVTLIGIPILILYRKNIVIKV